MDDRPQPGMLAVGLVSSAALAYEVLLVRLLSIIQWHHFAYMVISLALLGYGASGTLLSLLRTRLQGREAAVFRGAAALFGLMAPASFLLAQRIPFNALEVWWDPLQIVYLTGLYLLLAVPFMFAAACVALALMARTRRIPRVYAADLMGAGVGSLGVIVLLWWLTPMQMLALIGALGFLASALSSGHGVGRFTTLAVLAMVMFWMVSQQGLVLSPYKGLSQALVVTGSETMVTVSGPMARIDVLDNRRIPLRHATGLSLYYTRQSPHQWALFMDGAGPEPIHRWDGRREPLQWLDWTIAALPYHLLDRPRTLLLGLGGGTGLLQALGQEAESIDVVESNRQLVDLLRGPLRGFAGPLLEQPHVRLHLHESRGFISRSDQRWQLIQLAMPGAFGAAGAGLRGLGEDYLHTREAFADYLDHLEPGGWLAITRWLHLPPREAPRLFVTALAALEERGVEEPASHLAMVRSLRTTSLLVKADPLDQADIQRLRHFCKQRAFDLVWYPGMETEEANHFNRLQQPFFHQSVLALSGTARQEFIAGYPYDITPAGDDRPFFFDFFRWSSLREFLSLRGRGGVALLDTGYPVLIATLVQALLLSLVLILLPLAGRSPLTGRQRLVVPAYFGSVGLAFMLVEMGFIQRFMLFLSHPLYAVAVVLCGFLLFGGLGSLLAGRSSNPQRLLRGAVAAIVSIVLVYLWGLPLLFRSLPALPDAWRILLALALIAPLALCMGMPFPLGLARLAGSTRQALPWAWGINGCASVVSTVLAVVLAAHFGFTATVLLAVAAYLVIPVAWKPLGNP